ncbi:MAG: aldo/keto reductase [Myxococcota bacterium]
MADSNTLNRRTFLTVGGGAALAGATLHPGDAIAGGAKDLALPKVPRRTLGKTKRDVPILLFGGAVPLDTRFDPKLAEAFRFGVNYIDTADCYLSGNSEIAVGNFWTRARLKREGFWITSKSDRHDPEGLVSTLEAGLKKMKTSYVDLYYLHALTNADYLSPEMAKTAEALKKEGKIKAVGFSCHDGNVVELLNAAAQRPWIDSVMFRYNFRRYGDKELNKAMDACHKAGVGLIAMKTQGSEAGFKDQWSKFEKTGKWTKHQAVLKAVWEDERISAAVSAMKNFDQLRQNIQAALDKTKLTQAEWDALDRYAAATRSLACDGCDHLCNPAVQAPVQIGTTMRYLMYHDVYGEPEKAKALFDKLPSSARQLAGVDFSGANRACPHGVDVASHMTRAQELFTA